MFRFIALSLITLFVSQFNAVEKASAHACPDYYRFVDFGLKDKKGTLYRGGIVLRAEGFSAEALLQEHKTQCLKVYDLAKDGHGNPIPVVKSIDYIPSVTNIELNALRVTKVQDTLKAANDNVSVHLALMQNSASEKIRGENYVCAKSTSKQAMSCQLVSPYAGNIPLVIYCDIRTCKMPVMAINKELMVSAEWENTNTLLNNPENIGDELSLKAQQIHDFLKPLSAAL